MIGTMRPGFEPVVWRHHRVRRCLLSAATDEPTELVIAN